MSAVDPCLIRSRDRSGGLVVRVGLRLVDDYLKFLGGGVGRTRCWLPDTT
jgi:hypothetical protein